MVKHLKFFLIVLVILLTFSNKKVSAKDTTAKSGAKIIIDAQEIGAKVNPLVFGQFIEHLGKCINGGLWAPNDTKHRLILGGIREDVFEAVNALKIPLLRWPGGCFSDGYHWMDGIGPREKRPQRQNLAWGGTEDNTFGTDEFLQLCKLLKTEPLINVNLGSGNAEEARQWVEYVNGSKDTTMGKLRAENGHPEPYNVEYWGIGNESFGNWEIGYFAHGKDYAKKYLEFYDEMRKADPEIKFLAVGAMRVFPNWNKEVLEGISDKADFLSLHIYMPGPEFDPPFKKIQDLYYSIVSCPKDIDTLIDYFDEDIFKYAGKDTKIKIAFDEWAVTWGKQALIKSEDYELSTGLFGAEVLLRLLKRSERMGFANYAQLINIFGLINTNDDTLFLTPSYLAFKLFREHTGNYLLKTSIESPIYKNKAFGIVTPKNDNPLIESLASIDNDTGKIYLSVINKHYDSPIETTIEIDGVDISGEAQIFELNGDSAHSKNTFEQKDAVKITEKNMPLNKNPFTYSFPPHSVTVIEF